eukprot:NODE_30733_length_411_cov_1.820423.p3 GENE.NODE_30733_length_411_cov_1.820423~~NODE_30733_length_411_cov_1.820423.p3  ORF type:complete len:70 (+),score=11.04 NODE_30733_length_411_cov_1.820423:137-346(+)
MPEVHDQDDARHRGETVLGLRRHHGTGGSGRQRNSVFKAVVKDEAAIAPPAPALASHGQAGALESTARQ